MSQFGVKFTEGPQFVGTGGQYPWGIPGQSGYPGGMYGRSDARVEYPGMSQPGMGARLWGWAEENPEIASTIAGTALNAYGAYQQGKALDKQAELAQRGFELEEEAYRDQQEDEERERERRRQAYQRILNSREE